MLDADLAELYGVETRALIQAVKRNLSHFPADFMFQLTQGRIRIFEVTNCDLKLAIAICDIKFGTGRSAAFTLRVSRAKCGDAVQRFKQQTGGEINIEIMRTFVRLRQILASNAQPLQKTRRIGKEIRRAVQGCV